MKKSLEILPCVVALVVFAAWRPLSASNSCVYAFSSGSQGAFLGWCLSDHGNVVTFQAPSGSTHLASREGYAVCSSSGVHGYDRGDLEQGWNDPVLIGTSPLVIERDTSDGIFRFRQKFTQQKPEKEVNVKMYLTNLSSSTVSDITIVRYYDANTDGSASDNQWLAGSDGIISRGPSGHLFTMTDQIFNVRHLAAVEAAGSWSYTDCTPTAVATPVTGDHVGWMRYFIPTLGPHATKAVHLIYRRQ
jgi:hypothetical protein